MPGYKVYEYQLVLFPPNPLRIRINEIIKSFAGNYNTLQFQHGKAYILLAGFFQYSLFEERILNHLNMVALSLQPIHVELKDFGFFSNHTLYIHILQKQRIQEIVKVIKTETQQLLKFDNKIGPVFLNEPHITIAKKLNPVQFEQASTTYRKKHFSAKFIADSMLLLKRPVNGNPYEIVQRFEFMNMPLPVKQGNLFL